MKIETYYLEKISDDELAEIIAGLAARGIGLGLEGPALTINTICGKGVEGWSDTAALDKLLQRIQRLRGVVRYYAMDEPFWYGHFAAGRRDCDLSTQQILTETRSLEYVVSRYFPEVVVGDIEPLAWPGQPQQYIADLAQWVDNRRPAFLHLDLGWRPEWQLEVVSLEERLKNKSRRIGIIVDGDAGDRTDADWTQHASERFAAIKSYPLKLSDIIFQTWHQHPEHLLTEMEPYTLTGLMFKSMHCEGK